MRVHGSVQAIAEGILEHDTLKQHACGDLPTKKPSTAISKEATSTSPTRWTSTRDFAATTSSRRTVWPQCLRLIPTEIMSLEQLGIPDAVRRFGDLRSGLVLVTGPTGSGKSTTLAALMDYINTTYSRHIITVEEPIEFVHSHKESIITQREVPIQTPELRRRPARLPAGRRRHRARRRDARPGNHLARAHRSRDRPAGVRHPAHQQRPQDRRPSRRRVPSDQQSQVRTMLSASLRGVVAQLLLRRSDKPGRVAVNEILVSTPAVSAVIREGATQKLTDIITGGKEHGMQFMDDSIWEKLVNGMCTPLEAYMKAIDKSRFMKTLPPEDAAIADSGGGVADD